MMSWHSKYNIHGQFNQILIHNNKQMILIILNNYIPVALSPHHSTATQHQNAPNTHNQTEQNGIGSSKGKKPELFIYTNIFIRLTQCGKVIKLLNAMNKAQDRNEMMYPIYIHCYPYQYQLL